MKKLLNSDWLRAVQLTLECPRGGGVKWTLVTDYFIDKIWLTPNTAMSAINCNLKIKLSIKFDYM